VVLSNEKEKKITSNHGILSYSGSVLENHLSHIRAHEKYM